jgi:hypothetical protein
MTALGEVTADEQAMAALVADLKDKEYAQIRLSLAGLCGLALLGTAAFFIWRRR